MSKLGEKLFIIFLLLVILSLFLVGIFINFSIGESFDDFINLQRQENIDELAAMIEENIEKTSTADIRALIDNFSRTNRIPIWVEDQNGEMIYFPAQSNQMNQMMRRMGMNINAHQGMNLRPEDLPGTSSSKEIYLNGQKVLTLYWKELNAESQLDSELYNYFRRNVYQAIIFSALIVIILVIIISFLLSKKITSPLIKLKNAALGVAEGNYKHNISSNGDDELSELVNAFNLMTEKLVKLEKIRKESAADLAHELRTPVTTIKGYLEALEDGKLEFNQKLIIELEEETQRMITLIEKLNDFAEAQNKIFKLNKEKIDLREIINNVIKKKKSDLEVKNIELELKLTEKLTVYGDKDSLIQIFNNLIENAIKYNQDSGKIIIQAQKSDNKNIIEIKDTGIGISSDDLPYIFERFYRADKSRNSNNKGTGIGLAVARELMEAHQAKIEVESNAQGSLFRLIFNKED